MKKRVKCFKCSFFIVIVISIISFFSNVSASSNNALNGTFVGLQEFSVNQISNYLDEIQQLGMNTIIIQYTGINSGNCSNYNYNLMQDISQKMTVLLDETDRRGIEVYVGTVVSNCVISHIPEISNKTINFTNYTINYIQQNYGDRVSFKGWYIPEEPGLDWWTTPNPASIPSSEYWMKALSYYKNLVLTIKKYSSKPILIAPGLGLVGNKTPEVMAQRAFDFKEITGIDIEVWQDGIGAAGMDTGQYNSEYTLEDYYSAISNKIGKEYLWSDNELFNCCTAYSSLIGGVYKPASIVRIDNQLKMSTPYVSRKVSWIQQTHMGTITSTRHQGSARLFAEYNAFYGIEGEYIIPNNYTWITQPKSEYNDSGNEMFNLKTGNPKFVLDNEWVGIDGPVELNINLGKEKKVNWVSVHLLDNSAAGIYFPDTLRIFCSDNATDWINKGNWSLPINKQDSEYTFSNLNPLNISCKFIKVKLEKNGWWTFLSEIEIVGENTTSSLVIKNDSQMEIAPTIPNDEGNYDNPDNTFNVSNDSAGDQVNIHNIASNNNTFPGNKSNNSFRDYADVLVVLFILFGIIVLIAVIAYILNRRQKCTLA